VFSTWKFVFSAQSLSDSLCTSFPELFLCIAVKKMMSRCLKPLANRRLLNQVLFLSRNVADFSRGRRTVGPVRRKPHTVEKSISPSAPAPLAVQAGWSEVVDKQSGQSYWWNTVTNETTALGAPKPAGDLAQQQVPQQGGGIMSGLGRVVAEGFAFGVGSSVAHGIVGSIFGGGSHGGSDDAGGDDSLDL
jgi:hypothetical protein